MYLFNLTKNKPCFLFSSQYVFKHTGSHFSSKNEPGAAATCNSIYPVNINYLYRFKETSV